jgi:serine phosphatase RsbU (regulator of sigma subunit)
MVVEKILDAVNDFSGGVAAEDDLTLVAIRRLF